MNALAVQNPRHKCDLENNLRMIQSLTRKTCRQYLSVIIIIIILHTEIISYCVSVREERPTRRAIPSTYTRCWSRFIPRLASQAKPWALWTTLLMTSLRGLPTSLLVLLSTTRNTPWKIKTAVRLCLPGELSKHAVSEDTKAVTKYTSK